MLAISGIRYGVSKPDYLNLALSLFLLGIIKSYCPTPDTRHLLPALKILNKLYFQFPVSPVFSFHKLICGIEISNLHFGSIP